MKNCDHCKEEIKDEAVKCKHCGEFITTSKQNAIYYVFCFLIGFFAYLWFRGII